MAVRKADVSSSSGTIQRPLWSLDQAKAVTPQMLTALVKKATTDPKVGKLGAEVIQAAYTKAKAKLGANPTRAQLQKEIDAAANALNDERKAGRVNDGYIDSREAKLVANPIAAKLYEFSTKHAQSPAPVKATVKADVVQIDRAMRSLLPVAQAAFKLLKASPQRYENDIRDAFKQAAKDANLSAEGRAVLLTAVNGSMPRGDNGTWETGTFADVKAILTNAQSKLESADGAFIVDLNKPKEIFNAVRDDVITNEELDRTPSATGKTAVALLKYASTFGRR